jgi:WhiB family transcriptional regulator, redox-sensing transcriptional regulator
MQTGIADSCARNPPRATLTDMESPGHAAAWALGGACRDVDSELFFPEGTGLRVAEQERTAKQVCSRCLVRQPCLTWALTVPEADGIWGGSTPSERRLMQRAPRQSAEAACASSAR